MHVFQYGPSSESLDFHSNTTTAQKVDPLRHPHVPDSQSRRTGTAPKHTIIGADQNLWLGGGVDELQRGYLLLD